MRREMIFGVAAACLALAGLLYFLSSRDGKNRLAEEADPVATLAQQKSRAPSAKVSQRKERDSKKGQVSEEGGNAADVAKDAKKRAMRLGEVNLSDVNADDSAAVTEKLDELLDEEDYDAVLREAVRLKTHPDAEVRSRVLLALHWTGLKGLADLTGMLKDPDPDVASEAMDYWKMALSEVENSSDKAELLTKAGEVLGDDVPDETFNDVLSEVNMLDDTDAVPTLLSLLRQTEDADRISETLGALDTYVNSEEPMETKNDAERAVKRWAQEQQEQLAEDHVETGTGVLRRNARKPKGQ